MTRDWGPWTIIKLEALEGYFSGFTTACKYKAKRTLYLDLFGGRPENRERDTGRVFSGSAVRAASAKPPFTRLIVTELSRSAAAEQRAALEPLAGDRVTVVSGDCNEVMPRELARLPREFRYAPTFALVDQYSAEITWKTLRTLAAFKDSSLPTKVEICMYFGPSFVVRGLHGVGDSINRSYAAQVDEMFGNTRWRQILAARDDQVLSPADAQAELVNLMRWQLEHDLQYRTTLPLKVRNTRGTEIFSLIFATDHDVGEKIMRDLFEGAQDALDLMIKQAKADERRKKDEATGQGSLFDGIWQVTPEKRIGPRPPVLPPVEPYEYVREWDRDRG